MKYDQKNEITDINSWNGFPQEGGWCLPWGLDKKFSNSWGNQSRAAGRHQMRWFRVRAPPCGGVPARPAGKRPRDRRRSRWRDYISALAWDRLGIPQPELADVAKERKVRPPAQTAASATRLWLSSYRWMDGFTPALCGVLMVSDWSSPQDQGCRHGSGSSMFSSGASLRASTESQTWPLNVCEVEAVDKSWRQI